MTTKSINTKRLELYRKYVDDAEGEYPFDSRYELFSLAAVIGYLDGTPYKPTSDEAGYSQDFIKVDDIQRKDHQAAKPAEPSGCRSGGSKNLDVNRSDTKIESHVRWVRSNANTHAIMRFAS